MNLLLKLNSSNNHFEIYYTSHRKPQGTPKTRVCLGKTGRLVTLNLRLLISLSGEHDSKNLSILRLLTVRE